MKTKHNAEFIDVTQAGLKVKLIKAEAIDKRHSSVVNNVFYIAKTIFREHQTAEITIQPNKTHVETICSCHRLIGPVFQTI